MNFKDEIRKAVENMTNYSINLLIDNFVFLGDVFYTIGIPDDTPQDLKDNLATAIKAYFFDYKSLDYLKKKLNKSNNIFYFEFKDWIDKLLFDILKRTLEYVEYTNTWIEDNKSESPKRYGLILASVALIRMQTSFRAANLMFRIGYFYEGASITRIILEQLGWVLKIYELNNVDKILKTDFKGGVKKLKKLFPDIGSYYNILSDFTHLHPEITKEDVKAIKDGFEIRMASIDHCIQIAIILLILADYRKIVFEFIFKDYLDALETIKISEGKAVINEEREFNKTINYFINLVLKDTDKEKPDN